MVSVKNEVNDILLNTIQELEGRFEEAQTLLNDIQAKMDSKVTEAKDYKVSVDTAKEKIKMLEEEISSLEKDLIELKDKYGKKNLIAVIEAGTKEINLEIKKKQEEIQIQKNKISDLTNRARSIKDLLLNLKREKKIKEEKLNDLETSIKYYKANFEKIIQFTEEHDDLNEYFINEINMTSDTSNVFEDIADIDSSIEEKETNNNVAFDERKEVSIAEVDAVFNDVINPFDDEIEEENDKYIDEDTSNIIPEEVEENEQEEIHFENTNEADEELTNDVPYVSILENTEAPIEDIIDDSHDLELSDLLSSVKEPLDIKKSNVIEEANTLSDIESSINLEGLNEAIDQEFANVFGQNINEPIKTMDIFGNEYTEEENSETNIVNALTNIGLDYYSFTESDRNYLNNNFNEPIFKEIIQVLNDYKISVNNVYVDAHFLTSITPSELENIVNKLLNVGQSADAIGYVLETLPLVDAKLLDITINNYGDYIKNIDIADIIVKSLKGDN